MCLPKSRLRNCCSFLLVCSVYYKHNDTFFIYLRCYCLDSATKSQEQVFTSDGGGLEDVNHLHTVRVFDSTYILSNLLDDL